MYRYIRDYLAVFRIPGERLVLKGQVTLREWAVPPGGHLWAPRPSAGMSLYDQVRHLSGYGLADEALFPNAISTVWKNVLRDFMATDSRTGVERYAVGTGTTTPVAGDTQLQTEVFRDTVTSFTKDSAKLTLDYFLASGSANGSTLTECGGFGNGATGTANSGSLVCRATHTGKAKTSAKAFTYAHDFTLA